VAQGPSPFALGLVLEVAALPAPVPVVHLQLQVLPVVMILHLLLLVGVVHLPPAAQETDPALLLEHLLLVFAAPQ
jgi:hypothetical protein